MKKVDFFLIGVQKSGTTSLYEYLKQHPAIYLPEIKELSYFVRDDLYEKGEDYFNSFFQTYNSQKVKGAAYVHMFPSEICPERVKAYNPDAKFIVVFRNQIDRAYSAYQFAVKNGWESSSNSFLKTMELEKRRLVGNFTERFELGYFNNGLYYKHLTNWLRYFPRKNFLLLTDQELKNNGNESLTNVFDFLGVDVNIDIDTTVIHNKAGTVRFGQLQKFLMNKESNFKKTAGKLLPQKLKVGIRKNLMQPMKKWNMLDKNYQPLSKEIREQAANYFKEDNQMLRSEFNISL